MTETTAVATYEASEIASSSAAYLREHGLAQFNLRLPTGEACFTGAILIALGGVAEEDRQWDLWDVLGPYDPNAPVRICFDRVVGRAEVILHERGLPEYRSDPVHWNNGAERTTEEVAQLFDQIAEDLARA
ncbi:MAG TPA: hypothetical protein VGR71_16775 [Nitrospira sp.]|nr:hypothetical protein [Nitrospira sp.]